MSDNVANIVNDYDRGFGIGALANKYGKSKGEIRKMLVNSGVTLRGRGRPKKGSVPEDAAEFCPRRNRPKHYDTADTDKPTSENQSSESKISGEDYRVLGRKNTGF